MTSEAKANTKKQIERQYIFVYVAHNTIVYVSLFCHTFVAGLVKNGAYYHRGSKTLKPYFLTGERRYGKCISFLTTPP